MLQTLYVQHHQTSLKLHTKPHSHYCTSNDISCKIPKSREFVPFGCSLRDQPQIILYGGRWWLPPSSGRGESCVSKCPWQIPTPKGVPNAKLTRFGWFLDADSHELS
jgi:hypothetical protein